jgi:hypothetical protein
MHLWSQVVLYIYMNIGDIYVRNNLKCVCVYIYIYE